MEGWFNLLSDKMADLPNSLTALTLIDSECKDDTDQVTESTSPTKGKGQLIADYGTYVLILVDTSSCICDNVI